MIDDKMLLSNKSGFRRRDFLKLLGLTTGGIALNRLPFSASSPTTDPDKKISRLKNLPKIGLLINETGLYPDLGKNLENGLAASFIQRGITRAEIGNKIAVRKIGNRRHEALEAVKRLLHDDKCELFVGSMSSSSASGLHSILEENGKYLVAANAGANVVRTDEQSPYIFYNTLGYWQSNYALGEWAARHLGKNIFVASSFYESGYDALYAFISGAEAGGGKIISTYISHLPNTFNEMPGLMERIKNADPDFVFAAYNGSDAAEFLRAYSKAGLSGRIPLTASSFMAESSLTEMTGLNCPGMISCTSGVPDQNSSGILNDRFQVLGFDTGSLIAEVLLSSGNNLKDIELVRKSFRNAAFNSPRGSILMNGDTQVVTVPQYLFSTAAGLNGKVYKKMDELKTVGSNNQVYASLSGRQRTGWLNDYLTV